MIRRVMIGRIIPKVTAFEALAAANYFLSENLPDRFCADEPRLDPAARVWCVAVVLAYPFIGVVGKAGEITVGAFSPEVIPSTSVYEMKVRARALYEQHRENIEAAFFQAGVY